ncbi:hypothetical protein ACWY4P_02405 [Streptomyces sp. LZ34]
MTTTTPDAREDGALPPGPPLLVLDYPGHRTQAHVADLGLEAHGFRLHPLLSEPLPQEVTGRRYAKQLTAGGPPEHDPGGILAYCSASAIAIHYVRLLVDGGAAAPPLVVFDPEPTEARHITDAYAAALEQISGRTGPTGPAVDVAALLDRPQALLETVRDDLLGRAKGALRAEGLSDRAAAGPVAHFVGQHISWLAHLLAAWGPVEREATGPMLQVLSQSHPDHRDWLLGGEPETVRVDCEGPRLMAHPATREAVLEFLRPPARTHGEGLRQRRQPR